MKEPKVSIIMAAYNSEKTIEKSIVSIIKQTYKNWELIVINDGSKDGTVNKIKNITKNDNRIKLYNNSKNLGVSTTRNKGLEYSTGEWIAFLDSDDIWNSKKLETQMKFMIENKVSFSFTGASYINESEEKYPGVFEVPSYVTYTTLKKHNVISCSSVIVNKNLLINIKFEHDDMHEDYAVWLKILKNGVIAYGVNEPLLIYRLSRDSKSGNKLKSFEMTFKVFKNIGLNNFQSLYYTINHLYASIKKYKKILG